MSYLTVQTVPTNPNQIYYAPLPQGTPDNSASGQLVEEVRYVLNSPNDNNKFHCIFIIPEEFKKQFVQLLAITGGLLAGLYSMGRRKEPKVPGIKEPIKIGGQYALDAFKYLLTRKEPKETPTQKQTPTPATTSS